MAVRALVSKRLLSSFSSRSFATKSLSPPLLPRPSPLHRFRPLLAVYSEVSRGLGLSFYSTSRTASSLNDPSPNWSNRPPKETILLDGCDFEHWLVVMEPPDPNTTRDEIIQSYIKTLAQVVGSEEEARFKIYSVSTKHYFAFGALVSEELSLKIKNLPGVRWVLPDSYLDVKNKDYGGEPFINGEAVPYDPKYHEEWVRNNARANERNRRNDRPRDRSRNFERRRENMQNFQNRGPPPVPNQDFGNQAGQSPMSGLNPPPTMPNQDFGNQARQSPMPGLNPLPTMPNPGAQNPMPNQDFGNQARQSSMSGLNPLPTMPNPGAQNPMPPRDIPNMGGPSRDIGGYQNHVPNYQNNIPNNQGGYAPNRVGGPPGGNAYQKPPPYPTGGSTPQGGTGGYQGTPNAYQGGPGSYQGAPGDYRGPPNAYQGGSAGYQGVPNAYQGNPNAPHGGPGYQGAPDAFHGPGNSYQGGGEPAGGNAYQGGGPFAGRN